MGEKGSGGSDGILSLRRRTGYAPVRYPQPKHRLSKGIHHERNLGRPPAQPAAIPAAATTVDPPGLSVDAGADALVQKFADPPGRPEIPGRSGRRAGAEPARLPGFQRFLHPRAQARARPIAPGDRVVCCPVDGAVSQIGLAEADTLLQAKGRSFSLTALLGGDAERARPFQGGAFATLYLSPRDYHRIHMPLAGRLREMVHIPGKLFSVSPLTTRVVPSLFARNERVAALFDTPAGPMALVLVGAINVASMKPCGPGRSPRRWVKLSGTGSYPPNGDGATRLDKGAEMGRFNMG